MKKYELPRQFEQTIIRYRALRIEAASVYHRAVMSGGPVNCKRGCHECCHYPVLTSVLEALVLYRGIAHKRLWTSATKAKVKDHADKVRGLNVEVWVLSHIPCPLLHEGTCLIYETRPFSCRTVYSRRDPHLCNPAHSGGLPSVLPRRQALSEMGQVETSLMRKHRLGHIVLPMSAALLLAEQLDKGEIDFARCGVMIWKDHIQQW